MRLFKTPSEIEIMREAGRLTAAGHRRAMEITAPGVREYQVEAAMEYVWRLRGSARNAYPSIVGSGPNACILHYRAGDRVMGEGELVLVDAGCEKAYYAADVTRTWPVSGQFTPEQREIYALVLKSQEAAIDACRIGQTMDDIHDLAVRVLVEGLVALGLLEGDVETIMETEAFKRFYMHRTSHWIGMDVHDVGAYTKDGQPRKLEAGMVLTVEPGIYISPSDMEVPEPYRGIGIRIEDDILVTETDPDNLTIDAPKTLAEIESIVGTRQLEI
jgi:Xaa-Pro aminopeptidase